MLAYNLTRFSETAHIKNLISRKHDAELGFNSGNETHMPNRIPNGFSFIAQSLDIDIRGQIESFMETLPQFFLIGHKGFHLFMDRDVGD